MSKPLLRFLDPSFLVLLLLTALFLVEAGCSRSEDFSGEDEREYDPRRTVISRDRRRETPAPQPTETEKTVTPKSAPIVKPEETTKPKVVKGGTQSDETEKQAAQAAKLVDAGLRLWDEAKDAADKGEQGIADSLLMQAYKKLEQAHGLYKNLDTRHPNAHFADRLKEVETHMSEAQKTVGTGNW